MIKNDISKLFLQYHEKHKIILNLYQSSKRHPRLFIRSLREIFSSSFLPKLITLSFTLQRCLNNFRTKIK